MADTMTKEQRHYVMSRIRGKDTRPEMLVREYLHSKGFRYSLHRRNLPGSPDLVLRKYHTVIFVNGCFWHGHPGCEYATSPKTRPEYWAEKIRRNKERDAADIELLNQKGWNVIVIWECELKKKQREATLERLEKQLRIQLEPESIAHITPSVRRLAMGNISL